MLQVSFPSGGLSTGLLFANLGTSSPGLNPCTVPVIFLTIGFALAHSQVYRPEFHNLFGVIGALLFVIL
jgi:hypothetical protein